MCYFMEGGVVFYSENSDICYVDRDGDYALARQAGEQTCEGGKQQIFHGEIHPQGGLAQHV